MEGKMIPVQIGRDERRRRMRVNKRQFGRALKGVRDRVVMLSDEELDGHLGWMAQWLTRVDKESVVFYSIKMRMKIEQDSLTHTTRRRDA